MLYNRVALLLECELREEKALLTESQDIILALTAAALFDPSVKIPLSADWDKVRKESSLQTIPLIIYSVVEKNLSEEEKKSWKSVVNRMIANNMRVAYEHCEADELMGKNGIPYVIIKGMASAGYYPDPGLRSLGDVDLLVAESDMEKCEKVLCEAGFQSVDNGDGIHAAYKRLPKSRWEVHRSINGIPEGVGGSKCKAYMQDIIENALEVETSNGILRIPDLFHHGLILLLHTASHLTSEGIGLRHLCDWAVFYASLSEEAFSELFEEKLRECGLWKFACLLTLTAVKYLHSPERIWAGEADDELLEAIITDILNSGNFGRNDLDRYRQIKYISNRGEYTVDGKGVLRQLADTIEKKAKAEHKSKIAVLIEYAGLVIGGKRKPDNVSTLKMAKKRKNIYQEFHLFEV